MEVKKMLMDAVISGTITNVQTLLNEHKLDLVDDNFFDYELLKAALLRNVQGILKFLLKLGCRTVNPNESKCEEAPLFLAIKTLNVKNFNDEIIRKLISGGASVYDKNLDGDTPIQAAYKKGNFDIAKAFLMYHDPDSKSLNKDDLLHFHYACIMNDSYCAEKYLNSGIDPNIPLSSEFEKYAGLTPIQLAIEQSNSKLFASLVKHNGDLSTKNAEGLTPLHMIYYSHTKSWIDSAFKYGNNKIYINATDKYRVSHFHMCCMLDEPDIVKKFIDNGVNVNYPVSTMCPRYPGFIPLHFAVACGCEKVIQLLLEKGADPNKSDRRGKTPLHLACKMSGKLRRNIIEILLKGKASPDIPDKKGCTPLHKTFYYVNSEEWQIFDTLISNTQWQSDNCTDENRLSLFHIACTTDKTNEVVKFLDSGVSIDSCVSSGVYSGFTALHFACMYNQRDIVKILLKKNAKVNVSSSPTDVTPLHLACEFNYMKFDQVQCTYHLVSFQYKPVSLDLISSRAKQLEIIQLLLSHGSNENAKDCLGVTPLLHTCMIDTNYLKLDWTYTSYQDCIVDTRQRNNLHNEISIRLKEVIEILISHKANTKSLTNSQSSLLHLLGRYNTIKISDKLMKFLVESGVDVNAIDNDGLTPLHVAVSCSHKMLVNTLLKYNANPNVKCKKSKVPLHIVFYKIANDYKIREAIETEIFNSLLENGADVNIRDPDGSIMLLNALDRYKETAADKLLHYGADINMEDASGKTAISKLLEWEKGESWMVDRYGKSFEIIFCHVQKLLALGLPVSEKIRNGCIQLYPRYQKEYHNHVRELKNLENVFFNCANELDQMKSIKIDFYNSLYDILLKDSHELTKFINSSNLIEMLRVQNIKKFPLYGSLLKLQYSRGLKRSKVMEFAETALLNVLNVNLPNLCSNLVLKYLIDEDITNLKKAAPVKRNLKRNLRRNNPNQEEPALKVQKKEQVQK